MFSPPQLYTDLYMDLRKRRKMVKVDRWSWEGKKEKFWWSGVCGRWVGPLLLFASIPFKE